MHCVHRHGRSPLRVLALYTSLAESTAQRVSPAHGAASSRQTFLSHSLKRCIDSVDVSTKPYLALDLVSLSAWPLLAPCPVKRHWLAAYAPLWPSCLPRRQLPGLACCDTAIVPVCSTLCDPYLNLFRGIIPPLGGTIDLSPILAFIALDVSALP